MLLNNIYFFILGGRHMKCQGNFIFKGIRQKEGGEFVNANGQTIKYQPSWEVKFDDVDENNVINERKIKVSTDETVLVQKLLSVKPYTKVVMEFDVSFNSKGTSMKLVDIGSAEPKKD
jgi:hypothetical protein